MNLAFSTLCCPDWPLDRIIAGAVENGVGGIDFRGIGAEIDVTRLIGFTVQLDHTLSILREAKLQMPCLNTSIALLSPGDRCWEAMLDECHRHAHLAGRSQTKFVRIFGGSLPKSHARPEALLIAHRRLRQIIKICQAHGCRPIVQTHDDWVRASAMNELLDGFGPEEVGVLWDIEHPFRAGESPRQTVAGLGGFLAHVHIKDCSVESEMSIPCLLGQGDLPMGECLLALKEAAYKGWFCLETEKRWRPEAPAPEMSIPHFARYMRSKAAP